MVGRWVVVVDNQKQLVHDRRLLSSQIASRASKESRTTRCEAQAHREKMHSRAQ